MTIFATAYISSDITAFETRKPCLVSAMRLLSHTARPAFENSMHFLIISSDTPCPNRSSASENTSPLFSRRRSMRYSSKLPPSPSSVGSQPAIKLSISRGKKNLLPSINECAAGPMPRYSSQSQYFRLLRLSYPGSAMFEISYCMNPRFSSSSHAVRYSSQVASSSGRVSSPRFS